MRMVVMLFSIATLVLYGYALAGMGGYLLGRGRLDYIVLGLAGGTATAVAALWIWKKNIHRYFMPDDEREPSRDL